MPLGKEDIIHKQFAAMINMYQRMNKLTAVFWSYDASGEHRNKTTGSLLKSKGLTPGKADYEFRTIKEDNICHHIYIEFKTDTGKQLPSQKAFENTCIAANNRYYIARSVEEGLSILKKEGILK
jgi:hypothetical protein